MSGRKRWKVVYHLSTAQEPRGKSVYYVLAYEWGLSQKKGTNSGESKKNTLVQSLERNDHQIPREGSEDQEKRTRE